MISRAKLITAAVYFLAQDVWAERPAVFQSTGQLAKGSAEETDGDFESRARDLQQWLRQREAERQMGGQREPISERPRISPSSRYFEEHGYDAQGFKRLNENTRFRLRGAPNSQTLSRETEDDSSEESLAPRSQDGSARYIGSRRPRLISPAETLSSPSDLETKERTPIIHLRGSRHTTPR